MLKTSTITVSFDEETTEAFNAVCKHAMIICDGNTNNSRILRTLVKYALSHKEDVEFEPKKSKQKRKL